MTKPIFIDGKMISCDEITGKNKTQKIELIEVKVEYPETRLGTVEIIRVFLYDKNDKLLYQDNDIINNSTYFSIDDIKKEVADIYGVKLSYVTVID